MADRRITVNLAAELGASLARLVEQQRQRDLIPCGKCGGDLLRTDFTGGPLCHAAFPREQPIPTPTADRVRGESA